VISKDGLTRPEAIDNFGRSVRTIDDIVGAKGERCLLTIRHESLVRSPRTELAHRPPRLPRRLQLDEQHVSGIEIQAD
jgi:hypothetical protein